MAWKWFRSHHEEWLESQVLEMVRSHAAHVHQLETKHTDEVAHLEALYLDAKMEAMRERVDLKKAHAEELSRVIEDNRRLRDDLDRTRLFITPALQSVSREADSSSPPSPADVPTGTPWQRIQRREILRQEEEAKLRHTKPADAPVGGSDGSSSEGRVEAPQRQSSQPA